MPFVPFKKSSTKPAPSKKAPSKGTMPPMGPPAKRGPSPIDKAAVKSMPVKKGGKCK
jgi:hypothetical protein